MTSSMDRWLDQQADVRAIRGLQRTLLARNANTGFIDLASNDYLGLATDPRLARAAIDAVATWGTGATSSRLVAGTTELHLTLERSLAALVGSETALVFSSGYVANMGVITALGGPGTLIVADSHCHASMIDGFRLSRSRIATVEHNSLDEIEAHLSTRTEPRAMVAVESVYSVLGDAAPLDQLLDIVERTDAVLLVDEAHSVGITGSGRGSISGTALAGHPNVVVTVTLSKALGSQGGAVLGTERIREHLINRSRSFIFDTALAPAAAGAALAAVRIIVDEPWRAAAVHSNATALHSRLAGIAPANPVVIDDAVGAVRSIRMPDARSAVRAMLAARAAGVHVGCFRPPSVPDGVSRLRLTARATLTEDDIDRASSILSDVLAVAC